MMGVVVTFTILEEDDSKTDAQRNHIIKRVTEAIAFATERNIEGLTVIALPNLSRPHPSTSPTPR